MNRTRNAEARIGMKKKMNCGLCAEIVEYFTSSNITVEFEDGTILTKRYFRDFVHGQIRHPNISTQTYAINHTSHEELKQWSNLGSKARKRKHAMLKIGKTNTAKNGQKMTISSYDGYDNLTIMFEDGTVVTGQRYEKFLKGDIVNPNNKIVSHTSLNEYIALYYLRQMGFHKYPSGSLKDKGFGRMELDAYNPEYNIAVEYDGAVHGFRHNTDVKKDECCRKNNITLLRIRENLPSYDGFARCYHLSTSKHFSKEYEAILKTIIADLKIVGIPEADVNFDRDKDVIIAEYKNDYILPHTGEEYISSDGFYCKITKYLSATEVYVQYEDGQESVYQYSQLKNGNFRKVTRQILKECRVGESKIMNCGLKATIIRYQSWRDIDVLFEDGTVVRNKRYDKFKNGVLKTA